MGAIFPGQATRTFLRTYYENIHATHIAENFFFYWTKITMITYDSRQHTTKSHTSDPPLPHSFIVKLDFIRVKKEKYESIKHTRNAYIDLAAEQEANDDDDNDWVSLS